MITLAITNTSGVAIAAGDGVLPRPLNWINLASSASVSVVIQAGDLNKAEPGFSGFTLGDALQSLKQRGKLTYTATALGDTISTGSVPDAIVHAT